MADERTYSLAEANALLPEVRRLIGELRRAVAKLEELREGLRRRPARQGAAAEGAADAPPSEGAEEDAAAGGDDDELERPQPDTRVDPERFRAIALFHHCVGRFNDLGVQVKDVGKGLVDFPARAEGRVVLLCWLDGEDSVRHFHELDAGFAGRRPVEELGPEFVPLPPPRPDDEGEEEG